MELKADKLQRKVSRSEQRPPEIDTSIGSPIFKRRAVQFARFLGFEHENYEELPDNVRVTIECLGYKRIVIVLAHFDRARGMSMMQVATRYGLTKRQVQYIKV